MPLMGWLTVFLNDNYCHRVLKSANLNYRENVINPFIVVSFGCNTPLQRGVWTTASALLHAAIYSFVTQE